MKSVVYGEPTIRVSLTLYIFSVYVVSFDATCNLETIQSGCVHLFIC